MDVLKSVVHLLVILCALYVFTCADLSNSASRQYCEITCTGFKSNFTPCRYNYSGTPCQHSENTPSVQRVPNYDDTQPVTILRWNYWFDDVRIYRQAMATHCSVPCIYTDDHNMLPTADGLVFSIIYNAAFPKTGRGHPHQKWIAHIQEPRTIFFGRYLNDPQYLSQFDIIASYLCDYLVAYPYNADPLVISQLHI